jgi:hypothetical protein
VQEVAVGSVVHENAAAYTGDELRPVGAKRDVVAHASNAIAFGLRDEERASVGRSIAGGVM